MAISNLDFDNECVCNCSCATDGREDRKGQDMTHFNGDCACAFTISTLIGTKRNFLIQMKMLWEDLLRRDSSRQYSELYGYYANFKCILQKKGASV